MKGSPRRGSMEKVRLGRTNLEVTRLGWGGIPIQRISEDEAVGVVKAVIAMGVGLLDTARGYTTSEHRIGLALKQADRRVVLSTKSFERTARIYEDVLESLKALDVGRIDIYQPPRRLEHGRLREGDRRGGCLRWAHEGTPRGSDRSYRPFEPQPRRAGTGACRTAFST